MKLRMDEVVEAPPFSKESTIAAPCWAVFHNGKMRIENTRISKEWLLDVARSLQERVPNE